MSAGSPAGERQATDFITPQHTQPPPKNKQIRISDVNKTAHEYFTLKNKQIIARQQNMDEGIKVKNKDDSDADMAFFRSMMPDVQTMNQDQKRKLKLGVLNLIEQILKEPITSRISCPRSITPYQRTPSRESEYNSPANVGSYGSPTGSYGNQSPQQTHTSDAYGGLTLQQTHTTSGYGGLTLQQTQPTLQQIQPTLQQTQTTGAYGDPTLQQMQTSGAYRGRSPQRAGTQIYLPLFSPVTSVSPPSHQRIEAESQPHDGDVNDSNY
ncbi:unnamed protein product [Acanthoscelides obtectus]|uniref:BESS domain-containing protein n=1 Tax=Acanthoscelides obtectus TaxID=200917 RepID=A0A9P0KDA7_ACAOB|nr:unnamed protein product [Acanthoscelides obtectus]CAK1625607.1 hypothetical protein AOBTE_LOCUS3267 [Acanthoscelides obtectus]